MTIAAPSGATVKEFEWPAPDPGVLRLYRKPPPPFPHEVLGPNWSPWVCGAGKAATAPVDYVGAPLLSCASTLIGNARWPQAWPGWREPPHIWTGAVGFSGDSKSPAADCLLRDVLPVIEQRMRGDFDARFFEWSVAHDLAAADADVWRAAVRTAKKNGEKIPARPAPFEQDEPYPPTVRFNDMTIENVASVLATIAPKGVLIVRDEMVGWITGMPAYNASGRPFWVETFGGRHYRTGRNKNKKPVDVPRLVVGFYGSAQPDRLAALLAKDPDDGLLARILWFWPDPIEFDSSTVTPNVSWAIEAFDRLRMLEMTEGPFPEPIIVQLENAARELMVTFARAMQDARKNVSGLLRSAYGKARGLALRLSLVLEFLWWCGRDGAEPPPMTISVAALTAATRVVTEYFLPIAEAVYGDAAVLTVERNAAAIARWIVNTRATELYVRDMQRKHRLPGLRTAEDIRAAADFLVDSEWLVSPPPGTNVGRTRVAYKVNPLVHEIDRPRADSRNITAAAAPEQPAGAEEPAPAAPKQPQNEEAPRPKFKRDAAKAKPKTILKRPEAEPVILKRPEANPPEASGEAASEVEDDKQPATPNGNAETAHLSEIEQAIVAYSKEFPGLTVATIAKTFGQPNATVATLLGRQE
jgi:hypothetical protein